MNVILELKSSKLKLIFYPGTFSSNGYILSTLKSIGPQSLGYLICYSINDRFREF